MTKKIENLYQTIAKGKKEGKNMDKEINELILEFDPIIKSIILKIKNGGLYEDDMNDLMQEGRLGLNRAINSYDSSKNTLFSTHAGNCIRNSIIDFLRVQNTNANKALQNAISFDNIPETIIMLEDEDPEKIFIEKETLDNIDKALNASQKAVYDLYNQNYSYLEMSKKLGKTTKSIDNTLQQIKKIIRELN